MIVQMAEQLRIWLRSAVLFTDPPAEHFAHGRLRPAFARGRAATALEGGGARQMVVHHILETHRWSR